jgi:ActR/RegA family two-component response regulator
MARSDPANTSGFVSLEEKTDEYIAEVLQFTGGNLTQAAKILQVTRRTLQRKSKRRRAASG